MTPPKPKVLFAPGAGASSASAWMKAWHQKLASIARVTSFDYPYMLAGSKRPDPLARLIEAHRGALHALRSERSEPLFLAGKSMGSRVGCHLALQERVSGLVCFGYPLRSGQSGKLRDQVLLELATPILFVQGTRDPLCPLEMLGVVREKMRADSELYVVQGGDHSLRVTKTELTKSGRTQAGVDDAILRTIGDFVSARAARPE